VALLTKVLIALIAAEHLYILWVEMFAWTTAGRRIFTSIDQNLFEKTKGLAANQGLYNGFLSAGLIWSLFIGDPIWAKNIATFFLSCVVIAGSYGAMTSSKSIFFKQAMPALLVLAVLRFIP
jgi:putative membrane protein